MQNMTLKYAGNKLLVSAAGIDFSSSKDKYEYLPFTLILLEFLRSQESEHAQIDLSRISSVNLSQALEKILPSQKDKRSLQEHMQAYEKTLQEQLTKVEEEKNEALLNNLIYAKPIRLQRAFNKVVYELAIKQIVELIVQKEIRFLKVPMSTICFHVLKSIKNTLMSQKGKQNLVLSTDFQGENAVFKLGNL